jgi:hypothetical protein
MEKMGVLGLLTEMSASELAQYRKENPEAKDALVGFNTTPLFQDTRKFLINLLPELLKKSEEEATRRNESK